jgi:hypothetical protein
MGSGGWRQARIRLLGSLQVDDRGADGKTVASVSGDWAVRLWDPLI